MRNVIVLVAVALLLAGLLLVVLPLPVGAIPCELDGACPPCVKTHLVSQICVR